MIVTVWAGEKATGQLLILSQVVLSLQLPFAVVPLVMFTASRAKMGPFTAPRWLTALAALTAAVIIVLNAKLVWDYARGDPHGESAHLARVSNQSPDAAILETPRTARGSSG